MIHHLAQDKFIKVINFVHWRALNLVVMIQRIQSIYLLLAAIVSGVTALVPFSTVDKAVAESALFRDQVYNASDNAVLLGLIGGAAVFALVAIFLFKNRKTQLLLSLLSMLLIIGLVGFGAFLWTQDQASLQGISPNFGIGGALPVVALLFLLLARRSINKDEKLVRSSDRLR